MTMALDAKALEAARKLFTYQRTFNAIGAAVTRNETGIGISVKAFIEAFGSIDPPPAAGEGLEPVAPPPDQLIYAMSQWTDKHPPDPELGYSDADMVELYNLVVSGLAATPAARAAVLPERKGIYIASKTDHAQRWRKLRMVGYPVISTLIDEAGQGESQNLSDLWRRCIAEAANAEVFVLNRDLNETLKGGWIELGAALHAGVPVLAVGIEEFTIAHDKRIRHFASMSEIMEFLKPMVNGVPFAALKEKT